MSRKVRSKARASAAPSQSQQTVKFPPQYDRIHTSGKSYVSNSDLNAPTNGNARLDFDYRHASGAGPNALAFSKFDLNRARSRHEFMTNEYAAKAKKIRVSYAIGSGIRPHIKNDPALKKMWDKFALNSDPTGTMDFYGQQAQVLSEDLEAGESLCLPLIHRKNADVPFRLQLRLVESEYLPITKTGIMPDDAYAGIQRDNNGKPVAYYLYDRHPAEGGWLGTSLPDVQRFDAKRVFHVFDPVRSGLTRGTPYITKTLARMRNVEKYERADLNRKETSALLGVAVKLPSADDDVSSIINGGGAVEREEGQTYAMAPLEPGAILGLPPGADISVINPNDSSTGYKDAWQTRYYGIATGLEVPYFLLTGDFSTVNDRTLRFAMLDFFKQVKADRNRIIHQFNRKVWSIFLDAAEQHGWKPAAGTTREDYEDVQWIGEPMPHIHPVQEVAANTNNVRSGGKLLGEWHQENGSDLDTFILQKQIENEKLDAAGIVLDSDPRKMTKAGGYQLENQDPEKN